MNKYLIIALMFVVGCSSVNNPVSVKGGYGSASIMVQAPAGSPFSKVARKAVISITANDMSASSKELTVSANAVKGVVNNIPSGKNRKFDIEILDSGSVVKYHGSATADVPTDQTVSVPITLVRTSGNAVINGVIVEDSITMGYRYYKFVINSYGNLGGGVYVPCLVETHFVKGDTVFPKDTTGYQILSMDQYATGNLVAALFDNDLTANTGHVKPTVTPWSMVVDMKVAQIFTGFYMHLWETFFYGSPTSVTVFGATSSTGPWTQIGAQNFSVDYQEATIPLVY